MCRGGGRWHGNFAARVPRSVDRCLRLLPQDTAKVSLLYMVDEVDQLGINLKNL